MAQFSEIDVGKMLELLSDSQHQRQRSSLLNQQQTSTGAHQLDIVHDGSIEILQKGLTIVDHTRVPVLPQNVPSCAHELASGRKQRRR